MWRQQYKWRDLVADRGRRMKTAWSTLRTMKQVILLFLLVLIVRTEAQVPTQCITSTTNRAPENEDIFVTCGTNHMDLAIYICPIYHALYNESLMALNSQFGTSKCYGTPDWVAVPPLLRFSFPLNTDAVSACKNDLTIIDKVGEGSFADISKVQDVNISGAILSKDLTNGMITYKSQIHYRFSCLYSLQYLLNNTELAVSGVSLAINDNNGSFLSTLSMKLFLDEEKKRPVIFSTKGVNIKTKIYVVVEATNLTDRFNVLLDRCFASTAPLPNGNSSYDLFVGCNRDGQTQILINGLMSYACFSFEAFRFVEHRNKTVSVFYLHCVTRLCEVDSCQDLMPNCTKQDTNRRLKREAHNERASKSTTITSQAIRVGTNTDGDAQTFSASNSASPESSYSSPVVAVIVCLVILSILFFVMSAYFMFYVRRGKPNFP